MSVSVSMPQLGESVTEGTVTRWLKKEGERVEVDEPLLEVSTDKVDTEIPSPASGILRGISVDEDETVAVGAQLAVIDDGASGDAAPGADDSASAAPAEAAQTAQPAPAQADSAQADSAQPDAAEPDAAEPDAAEPDSGQNDSGRPAAAQAEQAPASSDGWSPQGSQPNYAPPAQSSPAASPGYPGSSAPSTPAYAPPPAYGQPQSRPDDQPAPAADAAPAAESASAPAAQVPAQGQPAAEESAPAAPAAAEAQPEEYPSPTPLPGAGDAPYVTPLVRKLAAEHAVDLESVTGTGVGGRIRKQDVIEAARAQRAAQPPAPAQPAQPSQPAQPAAQAQPAQPQPQPSQQARPAQASPRPAVVPSSLRGTTQRMSRSRQVIAQRMVESLHVSAQLTTVVEADVTAIARLRDQARQDFEAREGVKLSFLPFFALAAIEALKVHPKLNAVIDADQVTYHDAEHLGVAVDTERGLMVPVIHNAGDLNIGGLARKISDLASRTRSSQVAPDELAGGTFTLTNTGSRGALFDTPIINQPQVAILGTGTVVKRPVVVTDPALGEVIAVRSMVYLALTYDHRLVDGADAARFLATVKSRLEEGAFEAELGL
ncbi:MAG TPA: 2-oxoglutarate dehydrogenase, E2 component, dihydrolipoamide succinyltransferase [Streptosporangiaceae bacterium]|nr:2-oxoglutarate dehydrogenase, E2 component, dihydrolipoamide succinyltransferase [Streptosporangiaceae bacterium]